MIKPFPGQFAMGKSIQVRSPHDFDEIASIVKEYVTL